LTTVRMMLHFSSNAVTFLTSTSSRALSVRRHSFAPTCINIAFIAMKVRGRERVRVRGRSVFTSKLERWALSGNSLTPIVCNEVSAKANPTIFC